MSFFSLRIFIGHWGLGRVVALSFHGLGSCSDMKWICRAGEDCESEEVLGEISRLNYIFFAQ